MNNHSIEDESKLIRNILQGDQGSLEILYQTYQADLFAFITCYLDHEKDVEDVWQETWLAAIRRLAQFNFQSRFFTWLCGIARHKIADYYRKRNISPVNLLDEDPDLEQFPIDSQLLPEEMFESKLLQKKVLHTLNTITPIQKTVLVERYLKEQPVEQIAKKIHKSYKATESILSRARESFRKTFQNKIEG